MRLLRCFLAAVLLSTSLAAHADLLGDTFHATYNYPSSSTVFTDLGNFSVPGGGSIFNNQVSYNITATQVVVTTIRQANFASAAFNGFVFTDLTQNPFITGVALNTASTLTEGTASFTSNSLTFDFQGLRVTPGETAIYDLTFDSPVSATPEPTSFVLLGTGLLGVAAAARRRVGSSAV